MGHYDDMVGGPNKGVKTPSQAEIDLSVRRLEELIRRARVVAERLDDSLTQFGGSKPTNERPSAPGTLPSNTLATLNRLINDGFRVVETLEGLSLRAKELIG